MRRKPDFSNIPPAPGVAEEDRLLTSRDVARLLAVSLDTVKGWRSRKPRTGTGPPFIRIGGDEGRIRYSLRALRKYLAEHTNVRASAPFYRRTKIEELGEKHPGLREFVEERQRGRESGRVIAAQVFERWGETVSAQVLSNFYRLRVFPKESS